MRIFPRRTSFTVREATDLRWLALRVLTRWTVPRIEISIDGFPLLEAQRSQLRLRHLHEILERQTGALLAIAVLMIGLADMVRTWNRSLDHLWFLLAAAVAAGLAGRILARACMRFAVLLELIRLRWKISRWHLHRTAVETPSVAPLDAPVAQNVVAAASRASPVEVRELLKGSCGCGAVTFTLSSRPTVMGTCHCARCRKSGASPFVFAKRSAFRLISGADAIATCAPETPHQSSRSFCSRCGTTLGEVTSSSAVFSLAANCLDDDPGISNGFHEFVSEKPAWQAICDDARQYAQHPPA